VGSHAEINPRMKELNQQLTKTLIFLVINYLKYLIYKTFIISVINTNADLPTNADFISIICVDEIGWN
jgi:hypothetical protein